MILIRLKKTVRHLFACTVSVLVGMVATAPATANEPVLFEAKLQINQTASYDWSGTVFEAKGPKGRVFSFGFPEIFNTYRHSNDAVLHGFVQDGNTALDITDMGKPSGWLTGYFVNAPQRMLLANPSLSWALMGRASGTVWRPIQQNVLAQIELKNRGIDPQSMTEDCGYVMALRLGFEFFGNCLVGKGDYVSFHKLRQELQLVDGRLRPAFAGAGHLVLNQSDMTGKLVGVVVCKLEAGPSVKDCAREPVTLAEEFPYAIAATDGQIVIAMNTGTVVRYNPATKAFSRKSSDGFSFQLYTFARYGNRDLWGQYPDGQVGEMTGGQFKPLDQQLPIDHYREVAQPELQSFAVYKGRLYAGLWPFGEVYSTDLETGAWGLVKRLFTGPALQPEMTAPFAEALKNNLMGQRITDMMVQGDSLYITTGSKTGVVVGIPAGEEGEAAKALLPEYGKVWRVRSTGALAAPLAELVRDGKATVTLRITEKTMEIISASGVVKTELSGRPVGCIKELIEGKGTYGSLRGSSVKATVSINKLACK